MRSVRHESHELKGKGTVPSSVISISLSSESWKFANGRWRGTARCPVVGRGGRGSSSSLSLESEGDWRAGISSSVSLRLLLRCCWEGTPLVLLGVVEGRYGGMVVADNDRPDLATSCHHRSSADLQPWLRPSCSRWLYVFLASPSPRVVSNKSCVRGQAGGLAGTSVDLLFFPIDTVKTRLQSAQGFAKAGGFRGIYKGVGSVIVGSAPGGWYLLSSCLH